MIALIIGKVDCSAAELLAVNPFAPMAQTRCRGFGGATARLGRRNERLHARFKAIVLLTENEKFLSRTDRRVACSLRSPPGRWTW
jgi:hypothetical protein